MNGLAVCPELRGLSLCSGIGGLDLGLHIALDGYRTVCHVEREAFCASALVARMEDEALDCAPVWDDLATFDGNPWRGIVDIISAGYPCQPFSVAGRRAGVEDPRHLWPHVARIIGECEPGFVFLENVPGHLNLGFDEVAADLDGMGYETAATLLTASEVGATHRRERLFVLAHRDGEGVGDTNPAGLEGRGGPQRGSTYQLPAWPPSPSDEDAWREILNGWPELAPAIKPTVRGVADGSASRVDRLHALGNAVVPVQAAVAFVSLAMELELIEAPPCWQ